MSSTQSSTADADAPGLSRVSDKQGQTSGRGTPHPHARYNPAYQSIDIPLYSSLSPPDQEVCLCSLAISAEEEPALRVSLRKTRMQESRGLYWCLSHVWAHSDLTDNVLINGHRRKVNSNLFTNLCQLHAAKPGAAFWVDALCINQADLQERAAQVELMGAIYAKSKGVLVSFEDAGRTQRVSSLGIRAKSLVTYLLNLQCYPSAIAGPHASSADFKASARALCQLLKSQWFGRS
ncbi:hypothetical protein B0A50_00026 [Salinomyces thailandicus]|uniref:Heterokaryon incompatibility domain-containing protein n=1 Tax=Salinomyces thailandicus TaxID=706561 RepID=A0A4U0UH53_9PEZI|nr:hypothetical protein B0A50_00026 [Salinomyces thailandica]